MDENKAFAARRRRNHSIFQVESLEGRRLMAARAAQIGIQEVPDNGLVDLIITGTNKSDVISIVDNGSGNTGNVTVTLGNGTTYVSQAAISTIAVTGKGGTDQVGYTLTGPLSTARTVQIDLGAGSDQFTANLNGAINNATGLDLEVQGGAGNDVLAVNQSGAVQAGTAFEYLDGGSGNDVISYNGTGDIATGAMLIPALNGNAGNDTISSSYFGQINGSYVYNLAIDGGTGNDNIGDLVRVGAGSKGTVGTNADTPAVVRGGAGRDNIVYAVIVDPAAPLAQVNAVAVGDSGKDTVQHTANVLSDPTNEHDSTLS